MKKLVLVGLLLPIVSFTYAQQIASASIEVTGTAYFVPTEFVYTTQVVLSQDFLYDYYRKEQSLAEIKATYFQKIAAAGIDPKEFEENTMGYLSLGYKKDGVLLLFDTTSKTVIEKILANITPGARVSTTYVETRLTITKMQELATAAINKAREKAQKIAKTQNLNIGPIFKITDHQQDKIASYNATTIYNKKNPYPYSVTVVFELL